ncbi:hypothetical protein [Legionella nautarum]|nr:hypothetical protein [Legionella nautarum]
MKWIRKPASSQQQQQLSLPLVFMPLPDTEALTPIVVMGDQTAPIIALEEKHPEVGEQVQAVVLTELLLEETPVANPIVVMEETPIAVMEETPIVAMEETPIVVMGILEALNTPARVITRGKTTAKVTTTAKVITTAKARAKTTVKVTTIAKLITIAKARAKTTAKVITTVKAKTTAKVITTAKAITIVKVTTTARANIAAKALATLINTLRCPNWGICLQLIYPF